jgi:curli production assembly/transport component CsgF
MRTCRSKSALSWLSTVAICGAVAVAILGGAGPSQAGSLVYTPINPSFGGNPNNGVILLNEANAQNLPLAAQTAQQQAAASAGSSSSAALTPSQIFAQQLQSQLLSSFANQITQAIFGPNAQTSGTFSYGSTSISFVTIGNEVNITIDTSGSITTITVPATP